MPGAHSTFMNHLELIQAFAEKHQIGKIEPLDGGLVCLDFKSRHCVFEPDPTGEILTITCELEISQEEGGPDFADLMLKMNFFMAENSTACVSINPGTGNYALSEKCSIVRKGVPEFETWLLNYLLKLDTLIGLLGIAGSEPAQEPAAQS